MINLSLGPYNNHLLFKHLSWGYQSQMFFQVSKLGRYLLVGISPLKKCIVIVCIPVNKSCYLLVTYINRWCMRIVIGFSVSDTTINFKSIMCISEVKTHWFQTRRLLSCDNGNDGAKWRNRFLDRYLRNDVTWH